MQIDGLWKNFKLENFAHAKNWRNQQATRLTKT
jgi:hypothetical protein